VTDQQNRPQTLLEAAKAMAELCKFTGTSSLCTTVLNHLRAAIAREEAKQDDNSLLHPLQWWMEEGRKRLDRAQQAESTAAWHKAESERLSEDLRTARELLAYSKCAWQERAEKAEAELAERRKEGLESAGWEARAVRAERALLRAGWTDCGGKEWKPPLGPSHPMDGGDITVMLNRAGVASAAGWSLTQRIEWLVGEWNAERTLKESFRRDSQDVRTDMRAWNQRLGEVVPVADNPIDTVRAVIAQVHNLRCKVALAKEALGVTL